MRPRRFVGIAPVVLVLAAALPGVTVGAQGREGYALSLGDCLRTALENNLELVSARKDPAVARQQVEVDGAAFDPVFTAGASADETSQSPVDPTQPSDRSNLGFNATVSQQLNFGADYRATLFTNENDAPGFNLLNPRHDSGLTLIFNLPLLQGLGKEPTTERLLLSRGNHEISREELRRRAILTAESVEGAYWDVLAAREALAVSRKALERAKDLLELNRKKVEVGTLAPIEITQAEAGVASQEETVIVSETNLGNAEDELRRLMAVPEGDPMWNMPLQLTDRPTFHPQQIDLDAAIAAALSLRPEIKNARQTVRNRELSERVARKNVRHRLDLNLEFRPSGDNDESYLDPGPDGVAGTADDTIVFVKGTLSDSIAEIPKIDNYFWQVGLTYTLPLGNKSAKASYRIAQLNREKSEIDEQNQLQNVRVEVRAAVREVESGIKRVEAARKNVELQREKLDAEQKKFENGMSTSFEVLTFQNDLADAELASIRAALNYTKALAALERAKGTLLEARGLTLGS